MDLFNVAVILFLIMDPIGNISSVLNLLEKTPAAYHKRIIGREMLIALGVMVLFNFIGEFIFNILEVSETTLRLASGAILFLVAIKTLFPAIDSPRANLPAGEPFITPLAIPLTASPALLATIMLFAHLEPSQLSMLGAILASWALATVVLLFGDRLKKVMGINGLLACEKLMGMVLVMLAIQRFLEGVQQFVKAC
ncbi:MAG: MarC family protein [Parachlamydiaceae bacterium]